MTNQIRNYQNNNDAQFLKSMRDDEISLRELLSIIWNGKWLIIAVTTIFAIVTIGYAISQPNIYKSEVLLAPAESEGNSGGLGALAGQLGGLANIAGINFNGGNADKTNLAIEVMKSRRFISEFIKKHNILPELMAVESWDVKSNKLTYDQELYDPIAKVWLRKVEFPKLAKPSLQEAYKVFSRSLFINYDKETGMINISIEHMSPYIAQKWVNWLVNDINMIMKERDVDEAVRGQAFLEGQLQKTNITDMRTVLFQLMEQAQKTIMFANIREEYVFKTIDPAVVPEEKFKPKRALICILGTLFGLILSVAMVLIRHVAVNKE